MAGILTFKKNWADEFDVEGFYLLDNSEEDLYKTFAIRHPDFFTENHTFYFGTNEGFEGEPIVAPAYLEYTSLTDDEYKFLHEFFGNRFGQTPYILDEINMWCDNHGIEMVF